LTQLTSKDNNLADINSKRQSFGSSVLGGASSVENVPEIISMKSSLDGSATSRRWRIEQFLKNLVGKKALATPQPPAMAQKTKKSPSEHDLLQPTFHYQQQLQMNPDPTRSNCASSMSLNHERLLNKSTASLNSTSISMVHQKLWSVVPLLSRKEGRSCNNLLQSNDQFDGRKSNMRKCETVLALTHEPLLRRHQQSTAPSTSRSKSHSKSINNLLEPIKPLNRLRNSQSCYVDQESDSSGSGRQQTCSRCSSLLSLAAIGSNYSLNVTNGAFVLKSCKQHHRTHRHRGETSPTLNDENASNSSHNLIENDFNEIEPYEKGENVKAASRRHSSIKFTCKLCLGECSDEKMTKIASCGCSFCTEVSRRHLQHVTQHLNALFRFQCMKAYVEFEISEGAYELSCPDALCSSQGVVSLPEISQLASASLVEKHHRYRLNRGLSFPSVDTLFFK
jgi:E3 ubiquitin-protein ligase RNF144